MIYTSYKYYIDSIFDKYPSNECFSYINKDNKLSHFDVKDIHDKASLYISIMKEMDIKPGEKVCLISNNLIYSQITFICSSYSNICVVLIDPNLPLIQIKDMLSNIDVRLVLTDKQTYQKINSIIDFKALDITNNYESLNNLKIKKSKTSNPDEMAIIYSSGTTSTIKPIVLSYDSIINSSLTTSKTVQNRNTRYNLCLLPIYHISGIVNLFVSLYVNKYIQTVEYFNLNNIVDIFNTFNPNTFVMTPVVIERMIEGLETEIKNRSKFIFNIYNIFCNISFFIKKYFNINVTLLTKPFYKKIFGNRFKFLVCSSSQMPQKVIKRINAYGIDLVNTYASTECGNPITWTLNSRIFDNSVGRIDSNPNVDLKLFNIDENGNGEICVKSNSLMKCYYNDPELTASSYTEDGYFKTGDLGNIDNGYLYIVGRVKEVIKLRNGKKLSSTNLENLLEKGCPANNKVIICGYSKNNDEYDDIFAFFKDLQYSDEDKKCIKKTLLDFNNNVLKSYPIKEVYFINNIPTNTIGKVKKHELIKIINNIDNNSQNKSGILDILSKYISVDNGFDINIPLKNLGIDSLSMYSIVVDVEEKYGINIVPFLTSNTTTKDLINSLDSFNSNDFKLRRIKPSEIKEFAKLATEAFYDYPLYEVIYPDIETRSNFLFLNCWLIMYQRLNYSYVDEDKTIYIAYKKPGDKEKSLIGLFLNLDFVFHALTSRKLLYGMKTLRSYGKFADHYKNMYYNPSVDNYVQNMFVRKDHQGDGLIFKALKCLDNGRDIFAETHSKQNVILFKKMGIKVLDIGQWKNVDHYILKRSKTN